MDQTSRGYPYPECDPPLVKDASDIAQMKNLAEAIDADVTAVMDQAALVLVRPAAARMNMSVVIPTDSREPTPFYDGFTFNNRAFLADTANGGLRIQEDGWYLLGSYTQGNSANELSLRSRFTRNGTDLTNFQDISALYIAGVQFAFGSEVVFLSAGDLIRTRLRHSDPNSSLAWTYTSRIWILQIMVT